MIGESVAVYERSQSGTDSHGNPTYSWKLAKTVGGCLVHTATTTDIQDAQRPDGSNIQYRIAFPSSYDGPRLRGCRLALVDRGMGEEGALDVIGEPDRESMAPTVWDMLVDAGRADG